MFVKFGLVYVFAVVVLLINENKSAKVYEFWEQRVSWYEAFVLCKRNGMEPVSITSATEQDAIEVFLGRQNITVGPDNAFWTSGTRFGASNTNFVWFSNGKLVVYSKFSSSVQPPTPTDQNGQIQMDCCQGGCVAVYLKSNNKYLWDEFSCKEKKLKFICQSDYEYSLPEVT